MVGLGLGAWVGGHEFGLAIESLTCHLLARPTPGFKPTPMGATPKTHAQPKPPGCSFTILQHIAIWGNLVVYNWIVSALPRSGMYTIMYRLCRQPAYWNTMFTLPNHESVCKKPSEFKKNCNSANVSHLKLTWRNSMTWKQTGRRLKCRLDDVIEAQQFDREILNAIVEVAREMETIEKKSCGNQILKVFLMATLFTSLRREPGFRLSQR
ncbi:putative aspartate carbamoyltransferase [Helianthus anomalus]